MVDHSRHILSIVLYLYCCCYCECMSNDNNIKISQLDFCSNTDLVDASSVELPLLQENGTNGNQTKSFSLKDWCLEFNGYVRPTSRMDVTISHLKFYLTGICGFGICILGIVGNSMSIIILSKKIYALSTYIYLMSLAAADTLFLLFAAMLSMNEIFIVILPDAFGVKNFQAYTFPIFNPLANTFQTISIWLTLAFTVDRYIMICHPFRGVKFCSCRRAKIVVACLYTSGFIYNIPVFFQHETTVRVDSGKTYAGYDLSDLGRSEGYLTIYQMWMYLIFIFVLPCATLAVLNFKIIISIKESRLNERRLSLGNMLKPRYDTTVMLIAVVVVFFICQLPPLISRAIWGSEGSHMVSGSSKYDSLRMFHEVSNILVNVNSAVNILLYYGFSHKFRREFTVAFCKPCQGSGHLPFTDFNRKLSCRSADTIVGKSCNQHDTDRQNAVQYFSVANKALHKSDSILQRHTRVSQNPRNSVVSFKTSISTDETDLMIVSATEELPSNALQTDINSNYKAGCINECDSEDENCNASAPICAV